MAMEQCKKWLNRDGKDILRPELRSWKGVRGEDGFKKGWKAALEWVEDVASRNKDKKTLVEIIKELESGY